MNLDERSLKLIDELCEGFDRNVSKDIKLRPIDSKDLLTKLFTRFENSPAIYFSIGPGWFHLLADLHEKLFHLDPNYTIFQIKEKFGGLRFYASFYNISPISEKIAFDLIAYAESKSLYICEICSNYGYVSEHKHWLSARCKDHKNVVFEC